MIVGTGIDIVEIGRIKHSIIKYSDRFKNKVFTQKEIDYCHSQADPAKHFAARFSVKEAVLKCFGTGMTGGILWKDVEVENKKSGQPTLNLYGKGKELFNQLKIKHIHISITHDKSYAVAHAIAEK
ncbi:MAG: holo-ACP synthase [Nitrospinaceae bacterium]|jgi:holo-[acyl-carrier protein] synthase|tara:strand:+ start:164 stop:541 length:378 start_codon:yes stop_codon:yes gene_type:complete